MEKKGKNHKSDFDDSIVKAANNGEVLKEALNSHDCVAILCNSMKNLEENELVVSNHF